MTDQANLPRLPLTVADLVDEYDSKIERVEEAIARVENAVADLETSATVRGTYAGQVIARPHLHAASIKRNLLISAWQAAYGQLEIDRLATADDKRLFERTLADPPPFTLDNCKATFGDYLLRPRFHILRGLAEVFCGLDPAYKSHSNVKIGKERLPKRVILSGFGDYSSYGQDRFRDLANALAAVQGMQPVSWDEIRLPEGETRLEHRGLTVRRFKNGNAHVIFDKWALLDINRALAEFYGEVLPDVDPASPERAPSTAIAKDLQFYWSPPAVIDAAIRAAKIYGRNDVAGSYRDQWQPPRVLEPSCGDGRILDALQAKGCRSLGFEYDAGRAALAKAKGHAVVCANFLEQMPTGDFDFVVMNPPFYGKHYAKHVRHAFKFLKPGGTLVAVLPASACYDHTELDDLVAANGRRFERSWQDLPVASFAAVGTNIPTVLLTLHKPGVR
jgi:hypothetical protein